MFVEGRNIKTRNSVNKASMNGKGSFNLLEKIKKSKNIMGVYWNLIKKIKLTMRYSNGPQKTTSKTLAV